MSLRTIEVATARPYRVRVGPGALDELGDFLAGRGAAAVVTDERVWELQGERLSALRAMPRTAVAPGEDSKSFATLERVLGFLAASDLDRSSLVVAFGGGVVGDLAGLAAALYMRGIAVVQCPTTLLAMVDASVGGKTAVNLEAGKNLAGVFHQPALVLADTRTLETLSPDELRSGLGEVVKSALLGDEELLDALERDAEALLSRDPERLAEVVERCVRVKAGVVARDEREAGERKALNLGHTFAHAIERTAGYGAIPHGVAVATGLGLALEAGAALGTLEDPGLPARTRRLLGRLGLDADLAGLRRRYSTPLATDALLDGLRHDKKGRAGEAALVLPERIGSVRLDVTAGTELLRRLLA